VVRRIVAGRRLLSDDERPSHGLLRLTEVSNPKVQGVETLERDAPFDSCVGQFLLDLSDPPFNAPDACRGVIHDGVGWRGNAVIHPAFLYTRTSPLPPSAHSPKDLPHQASGPILTYGTPS
jgi:hypothetical protein